MACDQIRAIDHKIKSEAEIASRAKELRLPLVKGRLAPEVLIHFEEKLKEQGTQSIVAV